MRGCAPRSESDDVFVCRNTLCRRNVRKEKRGRGGRCGAVSSAFLTGGRAVCIPISSSPTTWFGAFSSSYIKEKSRIQFFAVIFSHHLPNIPEQRTVVSLVFFSGLSILNFFACPSDLKGKGREQLAQISSGTGCAFYSSKGGRSET